LLLADKPFAQLDATIYSECGASEGISRVGQSVGSATITPRNLPDVRHFRLMMVPPRSVTKKWASDPNGQLALLMV
jgi:hypothetical protein